MGIYNELDRMSNKELQEHLSERNEEMESFTFYRFEKVAVWTKDTYHVDATSKDEAQKLLLSSIENGDDNDYRVDYEVMIETIWQESPSVSIIQDINDNEIERTEK